MNVLLAFKHPKAEDPSACHAGMGVTAMNTTMALREHRIAADAQPVTNGEYLWAQLNGAWSGYTHVVLCAPYIDAAFLGKLVANFPGKQFALVYHSNLGFLSVDQFAARSLPQFLAVQKAHHNFIAAANSVELANAITKATGVTLSHLPNIYHLPHQVRRQRSRWKSGMALDIGLFGAARVLKNWLTAVAGAMVLQQNLNVDVRLHMSSGRDEGAAGTRASVEALLAMNPRVRPVSVPWLSVDDFRRYLYSMDLLLQPSFTETFNNVTADGCSCGVPSVVSEAIDWVPSTWIAKADSAVEIAHVGANILKDRKAPVKGWKALDRYNRQALNAWRHWLGA